jgi:hypothetical protein
VVEEEQVVIELHFQEEQNYQYHQVQYPVTVGGGGAGGNVVIFNRGTQRSPSIFQQLHQQVEEVEVVIQELMVVLDGIRWIRRRW